MSTATLICRIVRAILAKNLILSAIKGVATNSLVINSFNGVRRGRVRT